MRLSIYTLVKDGLFLAFHVVAMLRHHLPLADEIVVNEGYSRTALSRRFRPSIPLSSLETISSFSSIWRRDSYRADADRWVVIVRFSAFMNYFGVTSSNSVSHAIELILTYFPLGFCLAAVSKARQRNATATVVAVVLAIAVPIEYFQGWIVGRFPHVPDPCLSANGGWLEVWAAPRGAALFAAAVGSRGQPRATRALTSRS